LEAVFEADFRLEEYFAGAWETEPITPSIGGVVCEFDVIGSDDLLGASGNDS